MFQSGWWVDKDIYKPHFKSKEFIDDPEQRKMPTFNKVTNCLKLTFSTFEYAAPQLVITLEIILDKNCVEF
jgi:hypothetical protein